MFNKGKYLYFILSLWNLELLMVVLLLLLWTIF